MTRKGLSITVRSMVRGSAGAEGAEWTETVRNWKAAWAVVDDVCDDDRSCARPWSVLSKSKLRGQWFLDIRSRDLDH